MPFSPPTSVQLCLSLDPPPDRPDLARQVLLLRLGRHGRSYEYIAARLGCNYRTVRKIVMDAEKQLRGMTFAGD